LGDCTPGLLTPVSSAHDHAFAVDRIGGDFLVIRQPQKPQWDTVGAVATISANGVSTPSICPPAISPWT
jgi:hypothetical protein